MSNLFAYVQFLDDKSRNVVPEDDQANLEKYERSIYEGTILYLGASEESFSKEKQLPVSIFYLESPSETELDDPSSKILSMGNALPQAKTIDLLQTMKKNLTQTSKISSDSEYSSDGEVYLPKRKVYEYENKIINQKKKIKTLQNEIGKPSSRNKNKGNEIILDQFPSLKNHSLQFLGGRNTVFVKDLVSLLWSDEDLSQRSLPGKKYYNSKEIKQPLTPEKRFAIEEAFKDRLKKQQYHDATIALELKLNKNIPREEEKDLSENEPISNDMIN
ncbi:hypothetical protein Avbf_16219 [Armadillidium vulgare]|nr:hypothetical protein Avbf_16219 [Armadillidium vulgare]